MSNLVNVVKTVLGSKFDVQSFEAKNRVFEFDDQQENMFEFVRCSIKLCSTHHYETNHSISVEISGKMDQLLSFLTTKLVSYESSQDTFTTNQRRRLSLETTAELRQYKQATEFSWSILRCSDRQNIIDGIDIFGSSSGMTGKFQAP